MSTEVLVADDAEPIERLGDDEPYAPLDHTEPDRTTEHQQDIALSLYIAHRRREDFDVDTASVQSASAKQLQRMLLYSCRERFEQQKARDTVRIHRFRALHRQLASAYPEAADPPSDGSASVDPPAAPCRLAQPGDEVADFVPSLPATTPNGNGAPDARGGAEGGTAPINGAVPTGCVPQAQAQWPPGPATNGISTFPQAAPPKPVVIAPRRPPAIMNFAGEHLKNATAHIAIAYYIFRQQRRAPPAGSAAPAAALPAASTAARPAGMQYHYDECSVGPSNT